MQLIWAILILTASGILGWYWDTRGIVQARSFYWFHGSLTGMAVAFVIVS